MDIHLLTAAHIPGHGQQPHISARAEDRYYYDQMVLSRPVERLLGQLVAIVGAAKVRPSNMAQSIAERRDQGNAAIPPSLAHNLRDF